MTTRPESMPRASQPRDRHAEAAPGPGSRLARNARTGCDCSRTLTIASDRAQVFPCAFDEEGRRPTCMPLMRRAPAHTSKARAVYDKSQ
jgi:hypothetical protein